MSDDVSQAMRTLAKIVWEVRREYPRMELGQLHILLLILAEPGTGMSQLQAPTELTKAAVSRNVLALSLISYLGANDGRRRPGLNLVSMDPHPDDGRAKLVSPTARGNRLAIRLAQILGGKH